MKKVSKIVLIAAGAVFALGLVLHLVGGAMGGRPEYNGSWRDWGYAWRGHWPGWDHWSDWEDWVDWDDWDTPVISSPQDVTAKDLEAFTQLDVSIDYGDVDVVEGSSFGVTLTTKNISNYTLHYENKDGTLKVWSETVQNMHNRFGSNASAGVVITVPKNTALEIVDLDSDMGDVTWAAAAIAGKVELSTDMGDVSCGSLLATELKAETDMGDVDVGFPERSGVSYELSTEMGAVTLNGVRQHAYVSNTDPNQRYYVQAKTEMGDVDVDLG